MREKAIYPRQIYLIRKWKIGKRIKTKIARIDIYVKVPGLCTNEWQNLPTTDWLVPAPAPARCSRAFRTVAVHFSPFYTRQPRPPGLHRSDRYDNACQFPPRFFSPRLLRLPLSPLPRPKTTFIPNNFDGCFWRPFRARPTNGSIHVRVSACERARIFYRHQLYAIHFLFYTHFSIPHAHLISCTVNHRDVNYLQVLPQSPGAVSLLDGRPIALLLALQLKMPNAPFVNLVPYLIDM